jgi:hypothetical protein
MIGFSGLSSAAFAAVLVSALGSAACSGPATRVVHHDGPAPDGTDDPGTSNDPTTPDPSTSGDPTDKDTPAPPLVAGLAITDVAVYQAVKISIVKTGKVVAATSRNAPVVTQRPALIRAFVSPGSGYSPSEVTAELRLVDGTTRLPVIKDTKTITTTSSDEAVDSTFNFEVPADSLPEGVTYQIFLTSKAGTVPTGSSDARFPTDGGVQKLDAIPSGELKILIVPVKYMADGSGRTPDISAAQLALYKQVFMARYPAQTVTVTARAPFSYSSTISGSGTGFSNVLSAVTNLRKTDNAPNDLYYYGALAPSASFNSFCGGGCVTGLSTVVDSPSSSEAFLRASVGIGFTGDDSVNTAAHEVGHAHGRNHAPCGGAQGVDPDYPYSGALIGSWGYDIFAKTFLSPTKGHDMMGYCPDEWVSDYTYSALFDRIAAVNGNPVSGVTGTTSSASASAPSSAPSSAPTLPVTYRMANVDGNGNVSWTDAIELVQEPSGAARAATFFDAGGNVIGTHTAHFYPYDHLPGGVLVVPEAPRTTSFAVPTTHLATWTSVRIAGLASAIAR